MIQGWMYHGNFVAQLLKILFPSIPLLLGVRHSLYSLAYEKKSTALIIKLSAWLSRPSKAVLYNSKCSVPQHLAAGYAAGNAVVIPNGFDSDLFAPSPNARVGLRRELGLADSVLLIGLVARYHPMKDHANFLRAVAYLHRTYPDVHFVLTGTGVDYANPELAQLVDNLGIRQIVHLLGPRDDIPYVTAALDIASSSSYAEGFPNVVGEAMSCGVPCVVTDVGDSAWVVGDTGRVVPPRNAEALASAWQELIVVGSDRRQALGMAARQRILENFSLDAVVRQYENLYQRIGLQK